MKTRRPREPRQDADRASRGVFTLLEAMVGTAVFAVGALGSFGLVAWIVQANAYGERLVEAAAVGQSVMEELVEQGHDSLTSGSTNASIYDLSWTVGASNGFKTISLDVDWQHHSGQSRAVRLTALVAEDIDITVVPNSALPGGATTTSP